MPYHLVECRRGAHLPSFVMSPSSDMASATSRGTSLPLTGLQYIAWRQRNMCVNLNFPPTLLLETEMTGSQTRNLRVVSQTPGPVMHQSGRMPQKNKQFSETAATFSVLQCFGTNPCIRRYTQM